MPWSDQSKHDLESCNVRPMKSFDLGKGLVLGAAAASLLTPRTATAGGIFAGEAGSQAQSRGGAFVAKADDPSALMHNPAGLAKTTHFAIFAGANIVQFWQSFDRDGVYQNYTDAVEPGTPTYQGQEMPEISNSGPPQPIPLLAFAGRWGNLAGAIGLFAPQAYPNRDYPETVTTANGMTAPNPARYDIQKQESLAALPSIALAYRITDKLDIGVRGSWGFSTLKATSRLWALPNTEEDDQKDAVFKLDVKDTFIPAFGAGILFRPTPSLEFGASYSSEVNMAMKGTGTSELKSRSGGKGLPIPVVGPPPDNEALCATGGTMDALKACATILIPQTATVGGRYVWHDGLGREKADIELDVRWENWSAAKEIHVMVDAKLQTAPFSNLNETVLYHGFQDVVSTRVGGAYALDVGSGHDQIVLRGGVGYDTATAPDSWSRLDIDGAARVQIGAGASYQMGAWKFDLGGAGIIEPTRNVTGLDPFDPATESADIDQDDRTNPDPTNPKSFPENQTVHPFNEGKFTSGYVVIATGLTYQF
jgi:long-chain fatty acid transport protein